MAQILQGGPAALKPESKNLLPENVKAGQTIQILQGNKIIQSVDGTFTSDADIVASDIKQGKIAYSNGQKIVGTMPPYGPQTITPITRDQSFGPGVYLAGQINVKGDSNLIGENILTGRTIFSVVGKLDVLAIGGANNAGNVFYWNGSAYADFFIPDWASGGSSTYLNLTVAGKPMLVVGQGPTSINVCGVVLQNDIRSSNPSSSKITGGPAAATFKFVVLGTK